MADIATVHLYAFKEREECWTLRDVGMRRKSVSTTFWEASIQILD